MHHLTKIKVSSQKKTSPSPYFSLLVQPFPTEHRVWKSPTDAHTHGQTDRQEQHFTHNNWDLPAPSSWIARARWGAGHPCTTGCGRWCRGWPGALRRPGAPWRTPTHSPGAPCCGPPTRCPLPCPALKHASHSPSPQREMNDSCYLVYVTQFITTVRRKDHCYLVYVTQFITTVRRKDHCYLVYVTQFITTVRRKDHCYLMYVTQFTITVGMNDGCYLMYVTQFITTVRMTHDCYLMYVTQFTTVGMNDGCYLVYVTYTVHHSGNEWRLLLDVCYTVHHHSENEWRLLHDVCYTVHQWEWRMAVTWCMLHSSPVGMKDGCYLMYVTQFITTGWHKLCTIPASKACKVLSIWPLDVIWCWMIGQNEVEWTRKA